jgi:hypothetical protein
LYTRWGYISLSNPGGCLTYTSSANTTIQESTLHIHLVQFEPVSWRHLGP